MTSHLQALIAPKRVALIGASDTVTRLTARPQRFMMAQGFAGEILPINPSRDTVLGLPALPSIDKAGPVDHAYILLNADPAITAFEGCAAAGVKVVSMLADGFAEAGAEGVARQDRIAAIAREAGITLIGPNSTGVVHVPGGFYCTANAAFAATDIPSGGLSVLSQSGSMIGTLASRGAARGAGFSTLVSVGNEAVTDVGTLGSVLLDDPATECFALFLETLRNPSALETFARAAQARGKPVVAYVVGQSDDGQHLAVSHTGALSGARGAISCFLRDIGIAEVTVLDALLDTPRTLAQARPSSARPRSVTVLTTTGGGGGMVLDQISARGVPVTGCGAATRAELEPEGIKLGTGKLVDVTLAGARADVMSRVIRALRSDPETGVLVIAPGSSAQFNPDLAVDPILSAIGSGREGDAPIVVMPLPHAPDVLKRLADARVPALVTPESCAESLAALFTPPARMDRPLPDLPQAALTLLDAAPEGILDEVTSGAVFDALTIPAPRQVVLIPDGSGEVNLRYPVVAKLVSPDLPHKTDAGAIRLNIAGRPALADAIRDMCETVSAPVTGILVQEMASGLGEALIGVTRDPLVGPLVTLAAGGVLAEVLGDATMRPAPVSMETARDMIRDIRTFAPLRGYRGHPTGDLEALAQVIVAVSQICTHPRVEEAEINPILIGGTGVMRLDALIRMGPRTT
ncbi:acetate--CoA ligase family protein [Pseudooceanicola onchidii]|uniref:acetate--CoA ligase family protein n=1 Tax=Pseudooceanicola onchidii TaxID=2562279 RepID=UPI00145AF0B3|nr:acetate--CoA ligase family protein [Pseudooceanicola onchidii]